MLEAETNETVVAPNPSLVQYLPFLQLKPIDLYSHNLLHVVPHGTDILSLVSASDQLVKKGDSFIIASVGPKISHGRLWDVFEGEMTMIPISEVSRGVKPGNTADNLHDPAADNRITYESRIPDIPLTSANLDHPTDLGKSKARPGRSSSTDPTSLWLSLKTPPSVQSSPTYPTVPIVVKISRPSHLPAIGYSPTQAIQAISNEVAMYFVQ